MKRSIKYVALDVHQATTSATVRGDGGRVIARTTLPTAAPDLVAFFRGMRGSIHVAFEEGTQAQWLHDLLAPLVDRRPDLATLENRSPVRPNTTDRASAVTASRVDGRGVSLLSPLRMPHAGAGGSPRLSVRPAQPSAEVLA